MHRSQAFGVAQVYSNEPGVVWSFSGGWGEVKRLKKKENVRKWLKSLESKQFVAPVSNFKRQTNWMSNVAR